MESDSQYQHASHGVGFTFLSLGGVRQGSADELAKENMLNLKLQPCGQMVSYGSFNPGMAMCDPSSFFEASHKGHETQESTVPREDLSLTLGFGHISRSFEGGGNSTSGTFTQALQIGSGEGGVGFTFLSLGGVRQGSADELAKENMLNLKLQPCGQMVGYGSLNPGMAMCDPSSFFEASHKGNETQESTVPGEDLSLTLGFGHISRSFEGGGNSTSGAFTQALQIGSGEGGRVHVDIDLGLTTFSGRDLTNINLTSPRGFDSRGTFFEVASLDSKTTWDDCCLKARTQNNGTSQLEVLQCPSGGLESVGDTTKGFSSLHSNKTFEMDLRLGLSGSSVPLQSDCLSGVPLGDSVDAQEIRFDVLGVEHIPIDEGSTSRRVTKFGGYKTSLVECEPASLEPSNFLSKEFKMPVDPRKPDGVMCRDANIASASEGDSFHGWTSKTVSSSSLGAFVGSTDQTSKMCRFKGCVKGARGASGLCIAHGGGPRCRKPNCNKGAEGCTMFCKVHGGGRRCQSLGCMKSAEGKTDFCIKHGGGRRCNHEGCNKAARGRSGLCIRHGGGKRCQKEGCTKSAEGLSGLCISHGGGRRCQYPDCGKGAQGSTKLCKAHGGGRRCEFEGCTKGAEGSTSLCKAHGGGKRCIFGGGTCTKSVHGGTLCCVAHGGGKRCATPKCTKSARGRTDYCVRHGGGKRCKVNDCSKSAQGSTDFCKAHGGGKRCPWGQEGSIYNRSMLDDAALGGLKGCCDSFARGKTGLCSAHNALLEQFDTSGHGLSNFQGSKSGPFDTRQFIQPFSDLTEKTSQVDDEQSIDTGSYHSRSNVEGSWRRTSHHHHQISNPTSFQAQAQTTSRRCLATNVASQVVTDALDSRSLSHTGPPTHSLSFPQLFPCNEAAGSTIHGPCTVTIQHMLASCGNYFPQSEKMPSHNLVAPSSSRQRESALPDKVQHIWHSFPNTAGYNVSNMPSLNDPEERVHGGGHIKALLASEAASRHGQ